MMMTPAVFWSTMYQMTNEPTIAPAVPTTRAKNPNIDCPEVIVIPLIVSRHMGIRIAGKKLTNGYDNHCPYQPLLHEERLTVMKKSDDADSQCSTCDSETKGRFLTS
jgi:hypothetical protein